MAYLSAQRMIDISVAETRIVTVRWDNEAATELEGACDDHVHGNDRLEYWGTRDDGQQWRVHMLDSI